MSNCRIIPTKIEGKHGKVITKIQHNGVDEEPVIHEPTKGDLILQLICHEDKYEGDPFNDPNETDPEARQSDIRVIESQIKELQDKIDNIPVCDATEIEQNISDIQQDLADIEQAIANIPTFDATEIEQEIAELRTALQTLQTAVNSKEAAFAKNTAFNKNFGTTAGTVSEGNHAHSNYAPLASPAFTGTPTSPTAANGTNNTQLATTAFVQNAMSSASGVPLTEYVPIDTGNVSSYSLILNNSHHGKTIEVKYNRTGGGGSLYIQAPLTLQRGFSCRVNVNNPMTSGSVTVSGPAASSTVFYQYNRTSTLGYVNSVQFCTAGFRFDGIRWEVY